MSSSLVPHLLVEGVSKKFKGLSVLSDIRFEAYPGEIIALLGPSGCGKSTLLNSIAGFVIPDQGRITLNGRDMTGVPPNARGTAMVFQSYALFPHLNVLKNISYGLDIRNVPKLEVAERVKKMVELFNLQGLMERLPSELSGGQRQRVAVARAIATQPEVLLLDEALSALDKILREHMQIELTLLLRRLNITVILVTHDQREAFSMADRVAVMNGGRILQVGTSKEIYQNPRTQFVLGFIGGANFIEGKIRGTGEDAWFESPTGLKVRNPQGDGSLRYVRVENVRFSSSPTLVHPANPGRIAHVSFLGSVVRIVAILGQTEIVADVAASEYSADLTSGQEVFADFGPDKLRAVAAD